MTTYYFPDQHTAEQATSTTPATSPTPATSTTPTSCAAEAAHQRWENTPLVTMYPTNEMGSM